MTNIEYQIRICVRVVGTKTFLYWLAEITYLEAFFKLLLPIK